MFVYPLFQTPPYVQTSPICPPCSPGYLYVLGLHVTWGCGTLQMFGHPPYFGHPPCSPVHMYIVEGIYMRYRKYTPYVGGLGNQHICQAFWCLSVHPLHVYSASSCTFLVVYCVSSPYHHVYDYYSSCDCGVFWHVISFTGYHGSLFNGASYNIGSALCGSATTIDTKMSWKCYWPCLCATAATSIFDASSGLCQLCHGFSTGRFLFKVELPTILYIICLVSVLVSAFCFLVPCWMQYSALEVPLLGFAPLQPLGGYLWQAYVQLINGHQPTLTMHWVVAPSTALSKKEPSATQSAIPQPSHLYGGADSFGGLAESHLIPPPSLHGGEGSSFLGLVPSDNMVYFESVIGIKPGDSGVVIRYQIDEFTGTWSAEQSVAHSHIYPQFTDKVSSLTHFPLELGCEDYSCLDQAMADF